MPSSTQDSQDGPAPLATDADVAYYVDRIVCIASGYDFRSYTIGTRLKIDLPEDQALEVKRNLNRRVAIAVAGKLPDREPDPHNSDITFMLHFPGTWVDVTPSALFIYGRYLKFTRDLPQARWLCMRCHARGSIRGKQCPACGGTGKVHATSVEEIIAAPLLAAFNAEGTKMHATGRQDVDVRMLGSGRPFVIELVKPRRRTADLAALEQEINKSQAVAVRQLRLADRQIAREVDTARADKCYAAVVKCEKPLDPTALSRLCALSGTIIQQQTPERVAHRRADLMRPRMVKALTARPLETGDPNRFEMEVLTEAGTYVKELISGDGGRTRPSVSDLLGMQCTCEALDVIEVRFDPFAEESHNP